MKTTWSPSQATSAKLLSEVKIQVASLIVILVLINLLNHYKYNMIALMLKKYMLYLIDLSWKWTEVQFMSKYFPPVLAI